ncbi:MAG: DinB family protein [Anaerolineae bacterium]|nr:DinB family protein [Anaerolineae bacterium]
MDAATLKEGLWRQFGASIDYLADTMRACPDELWLTPLYPDDKPTFAQFWYRAYHTLFWIDLYLTGTEEGFLPPPPFMLIEQDDDGPLPERPYTKDELLTYLQACREKCKTTIDALTDEAAERCCRFSWGECSFFELLIYNLRHVQEHTAQLNLMLGQHDISTPDYKTQVKG